MLEAIRYVDLVIPEESWDQKITDVDKYHVDVFVMGDDWKGKFRLPEGQMRGRLPPPQPRDTPRRRSRPICTPEEHKTHAARRTPGGMRFVPSPARALGQALDFIRGGLAPSGSPAAP